MFKIRISKIMYEILSTIYIVFIFVFPAIIYRVAFYPLMLHYLGPTSIDGLIESTSFGAIAVFVFMIKITTGIREWFDEWEKKLK